jgi:hypothetical protein
MIMYLDGTTSFAFIDIEHMLLAIECHKEMVCVISLASHLGLA